MPGWNVARLSANNGAHGNGEDLGSERSIDGPRSDLRAVSPFRPFSGPWRSTRWSHLRLRSRTRLSRACRHIITITPGDFKLCRPCPPRMNLEESVPVRGWWERYFIEPRVAWCGRPALGVRAHIRMTSLRQPIWRATGAALGGS